MRSTPAKLAPDLGDDIENEPKALLAERIQSDARLSARGAARCVQSAGFGPHHSD
jgi:hypothetical protein